MTVTEKGYQLTFRSPKNATPEVIKDDVAQFAHVVVFAPETKSTCSTFYALLTLQFNASANRLCR